MEEIIIELKWIKEPNQSGTKNLHLIINHREG
jgi:hypothetical protein